MLNYDADTIFGEPSPSSLGFLGEVFIEDFFNCTYEIINEFAGKYNILTVQY